MIVLDTHTWIWLAANPDMLSKKAQTVIDSASALAISAISCWEFSMLVQKERITVDRPPLEWIQNSLALHKINLLPLTPEISVRSTQLGTTFHGDPADRIIVATALTTSSKLVTKDQKIHAWDHMLSVW
ncbi:type II toxin-antitoxin system VapC family toxin [Myxococcota bacterium]|nr:type II toxin-antitoxin system VapC family toxin [Myxococcota bacterium]